MWSPVFERNCVIYVILSFLPFFCLTWLLVFRFSSFPVVSSVRLLCCLLLRTAHQLYPIPYSNYYCYTVFFFITLFISPSVFLVYFLLCFGEHGKGLLLILHGKGSELEVWGFAGLGVGNGLFIYLRMS